VDSLEAGFYDFGMPVCERCGEVNPERARFCLACAAPLAAPASRRDERKRVSVLFCDLVGFTSRSEQLDVEDVRGLLAPYYRRLRTELEQFGGTVEKFIGDAVMALFGAPVAHEDDPERALRAALAIREAIAELNEADPSLDLHVRIGVTTGEALVALDARPAEGEGMASGDVINTAARLQAAAPVDGILVDETTQRAASRAIRFEEAEPVAAKGKAEPVAVWRAQAPWANLGVDVVGAHHTPLVGREHELGLLRDALGRVRREPAANLLTLVGVPGIGKSRLVAELLALVEVEPELTIWRQGRSLSYGEGVAFWALGEMVKAEAGILESDPAEVAAAKLDRAVTGLLDDAEVAWVAGHLRPLVGLTGSGESGSDRRGEAFAAWRRFLEALAERGPTVLVFEDLHWADDALLDFLDHLADWAVDVPLLVVCTARPELLSRRPDWGGGKPNAATLSLAPLSAEDTARLVAALLDQALLPAELQSALLARAGGNPLYAEEYVRMLADRGFLRRAGGTWRLERAEALPLPESVQGIIAARLDALAPEDKALLQDAAVLGKVGWLGALAALSGREPLQLEARLHALERRELLRRERRSAVAGERQYAFRHVLVRDVAYAQLPRATRAQRHQRVAEWLEGLSPDRAEDRAELLAHHYAAALQFAQATGQETSALAQRARRALRDAGDRALQLNAFAAAARWYSAALELWPAQDAERPQLLLGLGQARSYSAQTGAEELTQARDGLLAAGDREAAAEAEAQLGRLLRSQGQGERGMQHEQWAAALLEQQGPSRAKAFVLSNLAASLSMAGDLNEAIRVGRQALVMADDLGADELRARARNYVGIARVLDGDPSGVTDLEHAVAIAEQANSPHSALACNNLASTLVLLGELTRSYELRAKAREAAERFGLGHELRVLRVERVLEDYWTGRWNAALDGVKKLLAESETGSRHLADVFCWLVRGWIRLARGDPSGAVEDTGTGLRLGRMAYERQVLYPALAAHARALVSTSRTGEAEARAGELFTMLAEGGVIATDPDWSRDLAVVFQAVGQGAALVELLDRPRTPTLWLRAAAAVAAGDYDRAADLYAQIGSLPDEAFARLTAAKQLLTTGHRAEANGALERPLAFYRQVNANGYLREVDALLAASA
jgi:class 3 adenylate cyclase/tetratricopeptide (TPR) repeat protein